jgi:hypothetical protein
MITEQLNVNTKAVIIEIADVFYNMNVEEIPEDYPEEKEKDAHVKTINDVLQQARKDGYKRYVLLNRKEAEARQQNIGINGMYLIILKK